MVVSLRSFLSTEDFRQRLANIEGRMKDFYRFWQVHAPHYTDHGETHCKTVEMNLDELIPDDLKNEINEYEIFLLLSSVYLHDIGIMCAITSQEENEEIRKNHHKRSEQFITNKMKDLLNGPERYTVGKISFAHRDFVPLDDIVQVRTIRHDTLGNKQVRVRYLAGLLRLADSCDLCYTRTTENLVAVGKLPEEASFHHALLERVSGISFDTKEKTIFLDLNIASNGEKAICQKYLVDELQRSLDSVKDHLIRNDLVYIGVSPRFTKTNTLTIKLSVPKKVKRPVVTAHIPFAETDTLVRNAHALYMDKKYEESLKQCDKALNINPKHPFAWLVRARSHAELGELVKACESYDRAAEFGSDTSFFNSDIGHFYGEIMLDYEKSFGFFEKAYQQAPNSIVGTLNYAESLITVDKAQEAYNLATRIWNETTDIVRRSQSWTIRIVSLFFLEDPQKALNELKGLFLFYKTGSSLISEKNEWTYNKIRNYTMQSSLSNDVKNLLSALIDFIEDKISFDDFEQKLNNFPKK